MEAPNIITDEFNAELRAPLYASCKALQEAHDQLEEVCRKITNRSVSRSEMFVMPLEDVASFIVLYNGVVTARNIKDAIEQAFADDLRFSTEKGAEQNESRQENPSPAPVPEP